MWWRRQPAATLDDLVELLRGIGVMLMEISANVERIVRYLLEEDDDEA